MTAFEQRARCGVQWHEWKSLKRRCWSLWLKTERKTRESGNPLDPLGSYLPFSLLTFVDEWICDMHVHNIFVHPESGGAEKTKRWEEIIFNGSSPQICHTLCHFEVVCSTSPTLRQSHIYSITITSLNWVSRTRAKSPHLHKIAFPETGKYENFQFTEWKNVFHARNNGKFLFCVFCSRATKAIKIY